MLNKILIVFNKEMRCILRDKKTFIVTLMIPLVFVPLVMFLMTSSMNDVQENVEETLSIAVSDKDTLVYAYLQELENIEIVETDDAVESLRKSEIFVSVETADNFNELIAENKSTDITLKYNDTITESQIAVSVIKENLSMFSTMLREQKLADFGVPSEVADQIAISAETTTKSQNMFDTIFMILLPMLLITYSLYGVSSTANDLGAGEKERGTIEPLLSTGTKRSYIMLGKLLATTLLGVISAACAIIGMLVFSMINEGSSVSISFKSAALLFVLTVLATLFFSSISLALSIYARTFKEAQTFTTPLMIISMFPTMITTSLNVNKIPDIYFHIPLLNVTCVIKELISDVFNTQHFLVVCCWLIFYVSVSLVIANMTFKKESVIFRV